jgi:tRNA pseudouridine13 synthase
MLTNQSMTAAMETNPIPDWHRAHGAPLFSAQIRRYPEDFQVTEELGWELSGDGEHDYLYIEKSGANSQWVAKQLAQFANVPLKDVGFAGLKDRHAVTRQWFSVPRWNTPDWSLLEVAGIRITRCERHLRKLRRGAHRSNTFAIVLRCSESLDHDAITRRIGRLSAQGVPNYYGEQRFGRHGGNLRLADDWANGQRLPREKRSMAISTMRSYHFNNLLSERVAQSTWNTLMLGDKANLEGSGSVFDFSDIDSVLQARCEAMDIHPSATLIGDGSKCEPGQWAAALARARVQPGNRSLRLKVQDLGVEMDEVEEGKPTVALNFSLTRGAYATAVLRELCLWS